MKTAIVLAFDRLPACGLGAYGGVGRTPNLDRFAAGAVTFDGHFVHSVPPNEPSAWWTGRRCTGEAASVIGALNAHGVETHALVETAEAADRDVPSEFAAICETASPGDSTMSGRRGFAALVETACETLAEWRDETEPQPRLLWMHAVGLADQKKDLRTLSDAAEFVAALDAAFEPLCAAIAEFERDRECLAIITAALGTRFTDQEKLPAEFRLPEELSNLTQSVVQTPLVVRRTGLPAGTRRRDFTQPADIAATLLDWFDVDRGDIAAEGDSLPPILTNDLAASKRDLIVIRDAAGNRSVRTAAFALVARRGAWDDVESEDSEAPAMPLEDVFLFVKPDDYWDVHNVAPQEPAVVRELLSRLRAGGE